MLGIVHAAWADQDMGATLASLDDLPSEHLRQCAGLSIAGEAIRSDPKQALQLVATPPPTPERDSLLARTSAEWAGQAADEAIAWRREIADKDLRMNIAAGVATAMGGTDPPSTAKWLEKFPEGTLRNDALDNFVKIWSAKEPDASARWIATHPSGFK